MMSDYITKIRTSTGDKQIDYNALANKPTIKTLGAAPVVHEHIASDITDLTENITSIVTPESIGAATATHTHSGNELLNGNWTLIGLIDNAVGYSGTWIAPDIFGDGSSYDLGVYMIGGGGSGSAGALGGDGGYPRGTGGASGYGKNIIINSVSPGDSYAWVIGKKGAAVSKTSTTSACASVGGNAGGTTSFGGHTAEGGSGGLTTDLNTTATVRGVSGGQASNDFANGRTSRLYGCVPPAAAHSTTDTYFQSSQPPREGQNAFDQSMITLAAGGFVGETVVAMPDGTKGGNGIYKSSGSATAENATGYGNGGGAACSYKSNAATTAKSGAGSDGAIFIYATKSSSSGNIVTVKITVTNQDGHALKNIPVNGLMTNDGIAITDDNGVATGFVSKSITALSISGYYDLVDSTKNIEVHQVGGTIEDTWTVTSRNFLSVTSTTTKKFSSNVTRVDASIVGGGGNGGGTAASSYAGGGGGGGGYVINQENITFEPNVDYTATVGTATKASSFLGITANGGSTGGAGADDVAGTGGAGFRTGGKGTCMPDGASASSAYRGSNGSTGVAIYSSFTEMDIIAGSSGGGGGVGITSAGGVGGTGGTGAGNGGGYNGDRKYTQPTAATTPGSGGGASGYYRNSGSEYYSTSGAKGKSGIVNIRMHTA